MILYFDFIRELILIALGAIIALMANFSYKSISSGGVNLKCNYPGAYKHNKMSVEEREEFEAKALARAHNVKSRSRIICQVEKHGSNYVISL